MKLLLTILIALAPINLFADELETDLNGFRLQQFVDIADSQMGPPFKTFDQENSVVNAYQIDDEAYMVVEYQKKHPNNISSLQLTGFTARALPFKGLMLGDPEKKVERTLGTPDERTKVDSPPVVALSYKDKNYTVELDNQGRLYSIQIFTTLHLVTKTDSGEDPWLSFKTAILSKDFSAISQHLRPDVEIYKSGEVLSIQTKWSEFLKNPEKAFVSALLGQTDSVLQEILQTSSPEEAIRVVENFGAGRVFKFPEGRILREIVFFPYNGRYRVYEIAFKNSEE